MNKFTIINLSPIGRYISNFLFLQLFDFLPLLNIFFYNFLFLLLKSHFFKLFHNLILILNLFFHQFISKFFNVYRISNTLMKFIAWILFSCTLNCLLNKSNFKKGQFTLFLLIFFRINPFSRRIRLK